MARCEDCAAELAGAAERLPPPWFDHDGHSIAGRQLEPKQWRVLEILWRRRERWVSVDSFMTLIYSAEPADPPADSIIKVFIARRARSDPVFDRDQFFGRLSADRGEAIGRVSDRRDRGRRAFAVPGTAAATAGQIWFLRRCSRDRAVGSTIRARRPCGSRATTRGGAASADLSPGSTPTARRACGGRSK